MSTTKQISESTREKALSALEGMRQIVRREALIQGEYVTEVLDSENKSICGGRLHCAIGSLWVGAGVKLLRDEDGNVELPGVLISQYDGDDRTPFLRPRHGLRTAYDALNKAAEEFAKKHNLDLDKGGWESNLEGLFEGYYGDALTKRDLLGIISAAKRKVKAL